MNAETTLVLVPGTLCDGAIFRDVAERLADEADVIVADVTRHATIDALAEHVVAQAPPRFAIAGLSLGGIIAARVAQLAPERLLGLALFDTNLDAAAPDQVIQRTRWMRDVRAGHFARVVSDHLVEPLTARPGELGHEIFDMAVRVGPAAFLRQNEAIITRNDQRDDLASIGVPVLVANGALDRVCTTDMHLDLMQRLPRSATHVVIPEAGHLSTLDQPEDAARALRSWLQTCNNTKHLQEGNTNEYTVA